MHTMVKAPPWFHSQLGVPGSDTPEGFRLYPDAQTFFVDKGHSLASDSNDGTDPRAPLLTIEQGISNAVDGRGDLVLISPGSYRPTAAIAVNKSNIQLIGMPIGGNPLQPENGVVVYPAGTYTTGPVFILEVPCTLAYMDIATLNGAHTALPATASANVAIDGDGGVFNGAFIHIHHCRFPDWSGTTAFGIWLYAGAYILIENCVFEDLGAGIGFYSSPGNNCNNVIVRSCYFFDNTNGLEMIPGATPHNVVIQENVFVDYTDAIDFNQAGGGAGDGLICGNYYETATDAATYDCTVAQAQVIGWNFSGNHYSE